MSEGDKAPECSKCGDTGLTCLQCGRGYGGAKPCRCSIKGNEGSAADCECFVRYLRMQQAQEVET